MVAWGSSWAGWRVGGHIVGGRNCTEGSVGVSS